MRFAKTTANGVDIWRCGYALAKAANAKLKTATRKHVKRIESSNLQYHYYEHSMPTSR
jgi:hypothetical protein